MDLSSFGGFLTHPLLHGRAFWKRRIRKVKNLLQRMLGKARLTYDQLMACLANVTSTLGLEGFHFSFPFYVYLGTNLWILALN